MPFKHPSKERAWGTRYDNLHSSPPSPTKYAPAVPIPHSPTTSVVSSPTAKNAALDDLSDPVKRARKMPHDASIFVGSLPSNIEHGELTRLLGEHLSDYAEVKSVKVVRDTRGGVCAFVQCEDASASAHLIQSIQSLPPRPFLGRHLRYEPARAFRTLLISYRTPTQFVSSTIPHEFNNAEIGRKGHSINLELASAMRIFRPGADKFLSILYNADARNFEANQGLPAGAAPSPPINPFNGAGILLHPLKYDVETIRTLAVAFGPVEHFGPFVPESDERASGDPDSECPKLTPHDAPRSSGMDGGVWEVKWEHRDDCVSALMTLRRVPHLTVTWAHHMSLNQRGSESQFSTPLMGTLPSPQPSPRRPRTYSYGSYGGEYRHGAEQHHATAREYNSPISGLKSVNDAENSSNERWTFAHSTPFLPAPPSPVTARDDSGQQALADTRSPNWSESDFPTLQIPRPGDAGSTSAHDRPSWGDMDPDDDDIGVPEGSVDSHSPSSSLSVQVSTPIGDITQRARGLEIDAKQSLSPLKPSRHHLEGQELEVTPVTPDFSVSSLTPMTPRTGHDFPHTPTSPSGGLPMEGFHVRHPDDLTSRSPTSYYGTPRKSGRFGTRDDDERTENLGRRELDPMTLFVGGLEMYGEYAWDEEKLKDLFGRYDGIENINFVKPINQRSAFAFIQFNNTDAPARAVIEQHNRVIGGRQIRVQLRDINPLPRTPFKYVRGRGRAHFSGPPRLQVDINRANDGLGLSGCKPNSATGLNEDEGGGRRTPGSRSAPAHVNTPASAPPTTSVMPNLTTHAMELPSRMEVTHERNAYSAPLTPSPSSIGPSASVTGAAPQYSMPSMGYYPPAWMHPYPAPFYSYPYTYMGFPPPGHQPPQSFTGSDTSGSLPGPQNTWPSINDAYKQPAAPYAAYPTGDQSQQMAAYHAGTQPPLRATSFWQNDQGMLMPIYPPDALGQYMSNAHGSGVPPSHGPQHPQAHPAAVWQPHMYPYGFTPPSIPPSSTHAVPMMPGSFPGWVPQPAPAPYPAVHSSSSQDNPPPYLLPSMSSGSLNGAVPFRGVVPPQNFNQRQPQYGQSPHGKRYHRNGAQNGNVAYDGMRGSPGRPHRGMNHSNGYVDHA